MASNHIRRQLSTLKNVNQQTMSNLVLTTQIKILKSDVPHKRNTSLTNCNLTQSQK